MSIKKRGNFLPLTSVFASFIGAALVASVFAYNNYRFSQYKFVDFSSLIFYEMSKIFEPNDKEFLLVIFSSNQTNWREILKISNKNLNVVAVDLFQKRTTNEENLRFITSDINTILKLMNTLSITNLPSGVEMKLQNNKIYKQNSKINTI
ncbi:MAG: hypothetical protein ACTTJC_08085 [Campylobacter sp.]